MNRTGRITLAVSAVSAAVVIPLGAFAVGGSGSSACHAQQGEVAAAQSTVAHDRAALRRAGDKSTKTAKDRDARQKAVAKATKRLAADEATLTAAQAALIACQGAQPAPTATATVTATATATATATVTAPGSTVTVAPTVPAYGGKAPVDGTTLFPMTNPDGTEITPDGNWDGTTIVGSGYGSALAADPAHPGTFYGLTDRGPNVGGPDGVKMDPVQGFQPAIGRFTLAGGHAQLQQVIGLKAYAASGTGDPMNGLVPTEVHRVWGANGSAANDDIEDQYGAIVPNSSAGIDSEGLVVDPNGGFFVSDEYGPYIVHLNASGQETYRYSPYVASTTTAASGETIYSLPTELAKRAKNKGMEGLTITPDGQYLVGIMQAPLQSNKGTSGTTASTAAKGSIARIVKIKISDHSVQEYLYAMHFTTQNNTIVEGPSEITALDANHFIVDERDGCFEGPSAASTICPSTAVKDLWKIDLTNATDIGPNSPLINGTTVTYASNVTPQATPADQTTAASILGTGNSGLNINGKSIEDIADGSAASPNLPVAAVAALAAAPYSITTADSGSRTTPGELFLNYSGLVNHIDAAGGYFGHDKVEGVAIDPANPNIVYLADDSDFGITDVTAEQGAWGADWRKGAKVDIADGGTKRAKGSDALKLLPDGDQDFGEIMKVDLTQIPSGFRN